MEGVGLGYWASLLAVLGWIYVALASLWPLVSHRGVVKHGTREKYGYRIGWVVYFRLPVRAAILVVLLSVVPLLAVVFLRGWPVAVVLTAMTCMTLLYWMISAPGSGFGYVPSGGGETLSGAQRSRNILRSIIVLVVFGLIPASMIGAVLNRVLTRFVIP